MKTKHLRVALSSYFLVALIVAVAFMLSSCAGFQNLPSVCDDIDNSVLCKLSEEAGVRLEDIGNGFIIANAVAIGQGFYTRDDAAKVLKEIKAVLENPVSWAMFASEVFLHIDKYPGLIEIAEGYFHILVNDVNLIQLKDIEILDGWLAKQIDILGR